MDFEKILENWEKGHRTIKGKQEQKKEENPKLGDWLEKYLPNEKSINKKNQDTSPPKSEGRSVWLRRDPQDKVDLHGLNAMEARKELLEFIEGMKRRGLRKGLVIHGKGLHSKNESILKPLVQKFLESSKDVGEFGRAKSEDGGSGATWFFLRQRSR